MLCIVMYTTFYYTVLYILFIMSLLSFTLVSAERVNPIINSFKINISVDLYQNVYIIVYIKN